jgi:hypothetical protein
MARIATKLIQSAISAIRLLIEILLNGIGLFNGLTRRKGVRHGKKRIAFQAYSVHLAQFFQPVVTRLQKEDIEISFIILLHPQFSFKSSRELRAYARDVLRIPDRNI